jgi:hypothetical protein
MHDIDDIDKCTEVFSLKIPEVTKLKLDKLSPSIKKKLREEILYAMARVLHDADFDPNLYLKSE